MNTDEVKKNLKKACKLLYKESPELLHNRVHERTIASHLVSYLKPLFKDWSVDSEYNREGGGRKPKRGPDEELLLPDIIIHKRGRKLGPNLVAIQVKGYWNREGRNKDEADLRKLREKYEYHVLYRLELNPENFEIAEVN